ncbi:integrase core domain-containing protein [Sphingobacterium sp. InxBP1]|uniref:integrase core domain-containing protein n=1 Tax=Sphingobacterium sp. InxBP1 TaxID=2870328 RepID=UPI00224382A0|nr:integrase core domain-containing protein [Sphingobacterium sp. InxBP1]MCW8309700.1 integrase core domain-containing protein [Sphingobacterium sp. InxBP1]
MTENSDPYENTIAERINGILKQDFMIDTYHLDLYLMKQVVAEAIDIYNNDRPHRSNNPAVPPVHKNFPRHASPPFRSACISLPL